MAVLLRRTGQPLKPFHTHLNDTHSFELFFFSNQRAEALPGAIYQPQETGPVPEGLLKSKTGGVHLDGNHLVKGCRSGHQCIKYSAGHTTRTKAGCNMAPAALQEPSV